MNGYEILKKHGVTRLCHFTKFQKLCHILESEQGILASSVISNDIKNVTDAERYDGETNYVCCSIQYPNSWYLSKARDKNFDLIFKEWVILYIQPFVLNHRNAKFCPCNASKEFGAYINNDMSQLESIFAPKQPTYKYLRSSMMPACCPTDGQAEILIKNNIPRNLIFGIVVPNKEMAERTAAMLKITNQTQIKISICKEIFTKTWSDMVRNGQLPKEYEYLYD